MRKKISGLSLVEVIVSFAILLMVMMPIMDLTRGVMKSGSGFYKKYGQRGNIGIEGGQNELPIEIVDISLTSEENLIDNFLKNVKKLGYDDAPAFNTNTGYLGLKSLSADVPTLSKGKYEYILNWEAAGGSHCLLTSVGGEYYLSLNNGSNVNAINVAYQNPGSTSPTHSCYSYYGDENLNGKKVTMDISNGVFINMPSIGAVWNSVTQKGNANIPIYDPPLTNYNFIKIRPNPEFIYIEVITETGKIKDAIVTPIENYCLNNS